MLSNIVPPEPIKRLQCSDAEQRLSRRRYRHDDLTWSASEIIQATEAARENLRAPFYMYDGIVDGINFTAMTQHLINDCSGFVTPAPGVASGSEGSPVPAYTKGNVFFIKSMLTHPWRVMRPEDAQVIVIPIEASRFIESKAMEYGATSRSIARYTDGTNTSGCTYDAKPLMDAVRASSLYQARAADHLLVSFHWYSKTFLQEVPLFVEGQSGRFVPYFADALLATAERSEGVITGLPGVSSRTDDNIVSPYPPDTLGTDDCRLDSPRPVSFFFGGATQGAHDKHPGYFIRQKLFADRYC